MRHIANFYEGREAEAASSVTDEWLVSQAEKVAKSVKHHYDSLPKLRSSDWWIYTGITGVIYAFRHAASILDEDWEHEAKKWLTTAARFKSSSPESDARYLCSRLGVLTLYASDPGSNTAAVVREYKEHAKYARESPSDEIYCGRAGFIAAGLWMEKMAKRADEPSLCGDDFLLSIVKTMIGNGIRYSRMNNCASPLMYDYHGTEYIGACHGLAGILTVCLEFFEELDEESKRAVVGSIEWLRSIQDPTGNFPSSTKYLRKMRDEPLIHWCHGAPGVIGVFLKAYKLFGDEHYLTTALRAGELIWTEGVLKKGPGLCHGLSGNGYTMMFLWKVTGEELWLDRAKAFARLMMDKEIQKQQRVPDEPYSLYEGWAGGLCFLVDLHSRNRDRAVFPFYPLFL